MVPAWHKEKERKGSGLLQEAQADKEAGLARERAALEQEAQRLATQQEQLAQQNAQVGALCHFP